MRKVFKKAISVLLVAVMMFSIAPLAGFMGFDLNVFSQAAETATESYYTYTVNRGNASIISVDNTISGEVVIPSTLGGYPVVSLELNAFSFCTQITSIVIPDCVKRIEDMVFYGCESLEKITIGSGVKSIGIAAFASCVSLKSITIPAKVTYIGYAVFQDCKNLEKITVDPENPVFSNDENGVLFNKDKTVIVAYPIGRKEASYKVLEGTKSIAWMAFTDCDNIVSIEFPDSLTTLAMECFRDCSALEEVIFGNGLRSINEGAFDDCENLVNINLPEGITYISSAFSGTGFEDVDSNWENNALYIGEYLIDTKNISGTFAVKDGTKVIADNAMSSAGMTGVVIPDSVVSLGNEAFRYCSLLKEISIGKGVKNIGDDAFYKCNALEKITVDPENPAFSSDENGVIFNKDKTVLLRYPVNNAATSYTIPDGVEIISEDAFDSSKNLTSVIIPDSVTTIEQNAFNNCFALENLTLSENLETIGANAFYSCSKIKEIALPDGVTSIDYRAFNSCSALETIFLPDSVEYIGDAVFEGTAFYNNSSNWENDALYIGNNLIKVKNTVQGTYSIKEGTKTIGTLAINNNKKITEIIIPDSVRFICDKAFMRCMELTSIVIPEGVKKIGESVFYECEKLEDVTLPDSLQSIGSTAFEETAVYDDESNWENGVLYIGNHLIASKNHIVGAYSIKEGTRVIADAAFTACTKMTSLEIPASLTNIGELSLIACMGIEKFSVNPDNQAFITDKAGALLSKDKTVFYAYPSAATASRYEIPDGVEVIRGGAFYFCENLSEYIIPDSLKLIEEVAFYSMGHLTDILYAGSEEDWRAIRIETDNPDLYGAVIEYNYITCNHDYQEVIVTPVTCTEDGVKEIKCALCGDVSSTGVIPSSGHTAGEWEVAEYPTTEKEGREIRKCTVCFVTLDEKAIPMIPVKELIRDKDVIRTPSTTVIKYADAIILHVDKSKVPDGGYVEWTSSNGNFTVDESSDGLTCKITSSANGDTTFTATIYDAEGDAVLFDEQVMTSKACCFYKIIAFFKKLFGLTKTLLEVI